MLDLPSQENTIVVTASASARIAYRVADPVELHLRVANAFDDRYQDVFGYRTEGRSVHAGVRLALGR